MITTRGLLVAGSLTAGLMACHGRIDTPRGDSACLPSSQPIVNGVAFDLPDRVGRIRLPAGAVEQPLGKNPDSRKYILEDSTVLEVWVTPEPAAGMSASGGYQGGDAGFCSTQLGRFEAIVSHASLAGPSGDSVFVGMVNITLDEQHALNIAVTMPTRGARDEILHDIPGFLQL